jgi:surfactin synthase thioesterase subunit
LNPEAFNGPVFFILSHASGSAFHYLEGFQRLGARLSLAPLDLPGHGKRRDEPLLYSMGGIVADLLAQARPFLEGGKGYYVFGHSMGALNAFLLALAITGAGLGAPRRLFLSSYSTPGWHPIPPGMSGLPDLELWETSADRFGVLFGQRVPTEEQMGLFTPVYRADLVAVENYSRPEPIPVLGAPITAVYAESDMVDRALVSAWQGWTSFPLEVIELPGGHFHPLEMPAQLEEIILSRL